MNSQIRSAKHYIFLLICENPGITVPGLIKLIRKQIRLGWLCDQVCDSVYITVQYLINEGVICGSFDEVELLPTGIPATLQKSSALGKEINRYFHSHHKAVPEVPVINKKGTVHRTKSVLRQSLHSTLKSHELLGVFNVEDLVRPKSTYKRRPAKVVKHQAMSSIETLFYKAVKAATSEYLETNGVSVL